VVRDSRARSLRTDGNEAKLMQYYVPFPQIPAPPFPNFRAAHGILVRTAAEDPRRLASSVQRLIQGTSSVPLYARVRPYQDLIDPQLRSWRLGATLFSAFGGLALGIASVGLFAVVSYLVSQRTQEIGVRLALGGTRAMVARLVVWDALRMAGLGALAGAVTSLAGAPLVQAMLFQTSARETAIALAAVTALLAVAVGAGALPAWRASLVSPMHALRADT
jgi:ABC-type antimicrobial peptide transport system permease subunit